MVSSIRSAVTPVSTPALGAAVWVAALVAISAPLQERLVLLVPLSLAPLLLAALPARPVLAGLTSVDLAGTWAFGAALLLPLAVAMPRGPVAAAFTLPWLTVCGLAAVAGASDGLARWPAILRRERAAHFAADAALVGLAVGASWLLVDRSGVDVPGIAPVIVTLTAVHFHFAAFGLVGVAALLAAVRPGPATWLVAVGLVTGTLVTAAGFVTAWSGLNWLGALMVGVSGLGLAALLAGRPGGPVVRAASAALAVGMLLAVAWPTSLMLAPGSLDIDLMVRTHGVLNAAAVAVLARTAHTWAAASVDPAIP